jgi:hypothetical protein
MLVLRLQAETFASLIHLARGDGQEARRLARSALEHVGSGKHHFLELGLRHILAMADLAEGDYRSVLKHLAGLRKRDIPRQLRPYFFKSGLEAALKSQDLRLARRYSQLMRQSLRGQHGIYAFECYRAQARYWIYRGQSKKAQVVLTAGLTVARRAASSYWQRILGAELRLVEPCLTPPADSPKPLERAQILALGKFHACVPGKGEISVTGRGADLLAFLLEYKGVAPKDRVQGSVFPRDDRAPRKLSKLQCKLNKELLPLGWSVKSETGNSIRLSIPQPFVYDVGDFEKLYKDGFRAYGRRERAESIQSLQQALAIWPSEAPEQVLFSFLQGSKCFWSVHKRRGLGKKYAHSREMLGLQEAELGHLEIAAEHYRSFFSMGLDNLVEFFDHKSDASAVIHRLFAELLKCVANDKAAQFHEVEFFLTLLHHSRILKSSDFSFLPTPRRPARETNVGRCK